ncbi:ricin-type beta-trefoil lectin domain protein [Streptacidiphilus sp. MAP5-3]|uniref:ricin-type beta-trefoil lectin domain protein n=1 Tax=unclassified Streptacidiphilus TaxID=2643834 RepID=UPI003518DEA9
MRLRHACTPAAALLTAASALLFAAPAAHAAANPGPGFPAQYAAPYVETWNSPGAIASAESATGLKYYTLAFVISDGTCNATFNGSTAIDDAGWTGAINTLRASGGDVIVSFGGASGTELAQACGTVADLQAQYQRVIDTLNLTRIDLDVEGSALDDTAANDRRNQALANLQTYYASQGRTLSVDYTLPVDPTGLEANSLSLLDNAASHGLNVNLVNIMTMDYGPNEEMGQAAVSAAQGLYSQLGQIWPSKTSAQLWAMEGNTPMIGVNDSTNEVFTTGDAATLESFAQTNGVQELSYWALGRDQACASDGTLSDTCSGTSQNPYQFASTFNALTGSTSGGGGGSTGQITGYGGLCLDDRSASTANFNPVQVYTCNGSAAQQWTVGSGNTLQVLGKCLDVNSGGTANGTTVDLYDCNGTGAQVWVPQTNGSLLNPQSGRCLDDTNWSTTPGTQAQIWDCGGTANQQWTLPS